MVKAVVGSGAQGSGGSRHGELATWRNIMLTIRDIFRVRRDIFSDHYQMPTGRIREPRHVNAKHVDG